MLCYHHRSLPKKAFQKYHQKQNKNSDHRNTNQQGPKQHTSNNQIECSRSGAKGHRGNECRRSKNRTCSRCNKVGHFGRMCRSKEKRHQQHAIKSTIAELSNPKANADTDSDNKDIYFFEIERSTSSKLQSFTISINKNKVNMLIDSGSTLNIIDKRTYNQLHEAEALTPTYIKVYRYQASTPLDLEEKFNCSVTANGSTVPTTFYVMKSTVKCILGRNISELLNLLRVGPPTKQEVQQTTASTKLNPSTQQIINVYQDIFKRMGTLKNFKLQLHINQNITPVQQPIRRLSFHTKQKVSDELQQLQKLDIIEPAPGKTTLLNPVVPVFKPNGKIRICLDMQKANVAIERERHVIPKLEEILPGLHNEKILSKLDLREGQQQILLDEESRPITAFATLDGVYQYKRLIYGINSALKNFRKQI